MLKIYTLAASLGLLVSTLGGAQSLPPDLARIPAPPVAEFFEAFGARQAVDKVVFRSKTASGAVAKKRNTLFMFGVGADFRQKMYAASSCGVQEFELVHVAGTKKGLTYGLTYNCDKMCFGMIEQIENDKLKGVSRPVSLPPDLCDGVWSGLIEVVTVDGI